MAHYTQDELYEIGFEEVGENVLISRDARIYKPEKKKIGSNIRIDDFAIISGNVTLKNNIYVAAGAQLAAGAGEIIMEDFSSVSFNTVITASSADYSGESLVSATVPLEYKAKHLATIRLGRHAVVGAGSVLIPGSSLAEGTAVGAMSFVREKLDPWTIYAGNPIREIRKRKRDLLKLEEEYRSRFPILKSQQ